MLGSPNDSRKAIRSRISSWVNVFANPSGIGETFERARFDVRLFEGESSNDRVSGASAGRPWPVGWPGLDRSWPMLKCSSEAAFDAPGAYRGNFYLPQTVGLAKRACRGSPQFAGRTRRLRAAGHRLSRIVRLEVDSRVFVEHDIGPLPGLPIYQWRIVARAGGIRRHQDLSRMDREGFAGLSNKFQFARERDYVLRRGALCQIERRMGRHRPHQRLGCSHFVVDQTPTLDVGVAIAPGVKVIGSQHAALSLIWRIAAVSARTFRHSAALSISD